MFFHPAKKKKRWIDIVNLTIVFFAVHIDRGVVKTKSLSKPLKMPFQLIEAHTNNNANELVVIAKIGK